MRNVQAMGIALLMAIAGRAWADLGVESSRVIYPAGETSVALRVWNKSERPSLIQTWIDEGDAAASPETLRTPLMAIPPVFRLDPSQNRDVLLRAMDVTSLPEDRESLLWLNVLDIPGRAPATVEGQAPEYAVSWRLKVFYRPAGLVGTVAEAASGLSWRVTRDESGQSRLQAHNRSAFHVSLAALSMDGNPLPLSPEHAVVAPRSTWSLALDPAWTPGGELEVRWIDDRGKSQAMAVPLGG
ncbi:fimbrial biogenesis chaperone [[Pseudomonas] boreopolis]|uniref:fimbrial biogenesis chaperone n=1 Tax=Xanthomonas boreopolis TaxID=86183 RepID=UPI003DA09128